MRYASRSAWAYCEFLRRSVLAAPTSLHIGRSAEARSHSSVATGKFACQEVGGVCRLTLPPPCPPLGRKRPPWTQVQRHRLAGEAGELAGEGGVLELHQSHSNPLPLPEGVSVTVDTCQAGLGGKKAATPPSVFTVAADARAGVQPLPNAAERSALFSDVLGQVDFDPGHGASPRAMVRPRRSPRRRGTLARPGQLPRHEQGGALEGAQA
jgi:hypothetical protein